MIEVVDKYVGKEYEHNGRKDTLDCLGLVSSFLADNSIEFPAGDGREIEKDWHKKEPNRLIEGIKKHCNRIALDEIKPLDIVVFAFSGAPRHLGVMVDRSRFIHARENKKVAVIRLKHYKKYLHSVWRARCNNE